jgi:hypothetical protein
VLVVVSFFLLFFFFFFSDGDLITFDERGGRTRIGTTKQLSECVCIYRFYKSGTRR